MMEPLARLMKAKLLTIALAVPIFAVLLLDSSERVSRLAGGALFVFAVLYFAVSLAAVPQSVFARAEKFTGRAFIVRGVFFGMASMMLALAASAFWSEDAIFPFVITGIVVFVVAYTASITLAIFPTKARRS